MQRSHRRPRESESPAPDRPHLATAPAIDRPSQHAAELFEPVAFEFAPPLSSETMPAMEVAATDRSTRADPRVGPADSSDEDDQLDVAIPLSHWTEPAASQLKNAEAFDVYWSAGNGDESAAVAPMRATPSRLESPARADEPAPTVYTLPAPLKPRHVVFMLLAVVAVVVAVSVTVAILVERQFTPRAAAPTSTEAGR